MKQPKLTTFRHILPDVLRCPSMFATQMAALFILWVSSAAMVVTSALMVIVVVVFFRLIVAVTSMCHNGSLNGDLRSNFVRARASKSGAKSTLRTFFTARFVT